MYCTLIEAFCGPLSFCPRSSASHRRDPHVSSTCQTHRLCILNNCSTSTRTAGWTPSWLSANIKKQLKSIFHLNKPIKLLNLSHFQQKKTSSEKQKVKSRPRNWLNFRSLQTRLDKVKNGLFTIKKYAVTYSFVVYYLFALETKKIRFFQFATITYLLKKKTQHCIKSTKNTKDVWDSKVSILVYGRRLWDPK